MGSFIPQYGFYHYGEEKDEGLYWPTFFILLHWKKVYCSYTFLLLEAGKVVQQIMLCTVSTGNLFSILRVAFTSEQQGISHAN